MTIRFKKPYKHLDLDMVETEIKFDIGTTFKFEKYLFELHNRLSVTQPGDIHIGNTMVGELIGYSMHPRYTNMIINHVRLGNGIVVKLTTKFLLQTSTIESSMKTNYSTRHDLAELNNQVRHSLFKLSEEVGMDKEAVVFNVTNILGVPVEYIDLTTENGYFKIFIKYSKWVDLETILQKFERITYNGIGYTHIKSS